MKIMILDDEPLARSRASRVLARLGYDDVVAAEGVQQARTLLKAQQIDLILCDIHMPTEDGIQFIGSMSDQSPPPAIIMVSADEDYALSAVNAGAQAYLVKPLDVDALAAAIQRIRHGNRLIQNREQQTLSVVTAGGQERLLLNDILFFQAEDKYVQAVLEQRQIVLSESLKQLEERYSSMFMRCHRKTLVNRSKVTSLKKTLDGWVLHLKGAETALPVSRRHVAMIKQELSTE